MAQIINLRMARKARSRTDAAKAADVARAAHGRTKAEKSLSQAEADRAAKLLDGAKRESD